MTSERLQKVIAQAGVCSRREADGMVRDGRVTVNGRVAVPGDRADPSKDAIKIDGKRLKAPEKHRYILLNKPRGVMTTSEDPEGRRTVIDLLGNRVKERVFPIGRLDFHSEGLLVLTNDGAFAAMVAHPRYGLNREYEAKVKGVPGASDVSTIRKGTYVDGRKVVPKELELLRTTPGGGNSWWRVVVGEGRTHEVRELFLRAGFPVQRLQRTAIGPLRDGRLPSGAWRDLLPHEIELLRPAGRRSVTRRIDEQTAPTGLHSPARRVRSGKADRGGAARAGRQRNRQTGVERKSPRTVAKGRRGDS